MNPIHALASVEEFLTNIYHFGSTDITATIVVGVVGFVALAICQAAVNAISR